MRAGLWLRNPATLVHKQLSGVCCRRCRSHRSRLTGGTLLIIFFASTVIEARVPKFPRFSTIRDRYVFRCQHTTSVHNSLQGPAHEPRPLPPRALVAAPSGMQLSRTVTAVPLVKRNCQLSCFQPCRLRVVYLRHRTLCATVAYSFGRQAPAKGPFDLLGRRPVVLFGTGAAGLVAVIALVAKLGGSSGNGAGKGGPVGSGGGGGSSGGTAAQAGFCFYTSIVAFSISHALMLLAQLSYHITFRIVLLKHTLPPHFSTPAAARQ